MKQRILPAAYAMPAITPPAFVHPRVMLLPDELEAARKRMDAPENAGARALWNQLLNVHVTGKGATPEYGSYHLREYLAVEARAFQALLEQTASTSREAIDRLFVLLNAFEVLGGNMGARWCGHLIFLSALVYDWCFEWLTEEEKNKIIDRCEEMAAEYFEMGYPPSRQGALQGHGSEAQLLRDLLAFAIAVFDERPDIYQFCAGRIFTEYIPANACHFASQAHLQGPTYGCYRYTWNLWAGLLLQKISGQQIWDENFIRVADYFLYMLRPDGQLFRLGDDCTEMKNDTLVWNPLTVPMFLSGVYAGEPRYIEYYQKHQSDDFLLPSKWGMDYYEGGSFGEGVLSPVTVLIWNRPELWHQKSEPLPKARYFPYPLGMTVWNDPSNQTALLMKIGELWGSNHDHFDTGCFQIWCGGLLASDSGIYDSYHTSHRKQYLIQTCAHNCLTVSDESNVDAGTRVPNGGQETPDPAQWGALYRMAHVISHSEWDNGCEIVGDLSPAYAHTCEKVQRKMRFEQKEDSGIFIVSDSIVSFKPEAIKTFHLHVQSEPVVHGNEIIVRAGKGIMHCRVVEPANAVISVIGGEGQQFVANGQQYEPQRVCCHSEEGWGQVLIRPAQASKECYFLIEMSISI